MLKNNENTYTIHSSKANRSDATPDAVTSRKHPTDRSASLKAEKLTRKLATSIKSNPVFKPINAGVDIASKRLLFKALSFLKYGSITIVETYGKKPKSHFFGNKTNDIDFKKQQGEVAGTHPLHVKIHVHTPHFYRHLITGGQIAFADSYINGEWEVNDLTALIRLAARNSKMTDKLHSKFTGLTKAFELKKHKSRSNTVGNSKSNILAHYDLGNDMYQTFLDDSMMYSSAIYKTVDTPLYEAQQQKLKSLCELLELKPTDSLIEIGTGWGGFAIYAAKNYGCHVTTTTISDAQYDEAKKRVKQAGLTDKITLLKQDYRKLTGTYDKLVSIEMVEAVGHEYLPVFFDKCSSLIKPNGIMALQAITFNDQGYNEYLNSVDFIQSHIFPGGCLLSNQEIINQYTQQTDMVVKSLQDYGYDYAYTLRDWRHAFLANKDAIMKMGYDEAFIRLWHFYFAYCEGGFLEKTIGVVQVKAVKPDYR